VLAERQVAVALTVANRWPEDEPWPLISSSRERFADLLMTLPEPPRPPTAEDVKELELLRALGVGRGRR
jgi:hypothetical protein